MDITNMDITQLPQAVRFGAQMPSSVDGTQTLSRFQASNGNTFKSDGANEIRINVSAPGFLCGEESYLQFTLTNKDATHTMTLQGSGSCVFDQLRIESNGTELERIENYGLLDNLLHAQEGDISHANMLMSGGGKAPALAWQGVGTDIAGNASFDCTISLRSGFLKNTMKKAIPLVGTGGITIILRMDTNTARCVRAPTGQTISAVEVSNPIFFAPVFQINDADFAQRYQSMLSQVGLDWTGVSYKHYQNAVPASTGPQTGQLNDRSRSLRGFLTIVRPDSETAGADVQSFKSAIANISKYEYEINGQIYPQGGVEYSTTRYGRAMQESTKLLGYSKTRVSGDNFVATGPTACGLLCVDLKKYCDPGLTMTGLNTASSTTPSTVVVTKSANGAAQTLNTYAVCDALYRVDASGAFSVMM